MAYCDEHGIPHSRFLSWDQLDQDKALAFRRYRLMLCSSCGTDPALWRQDRDAYVGQARLCPGCQRLEQERKNIPTDAQAFTHVYLAPAALASSEPVTS